MFFITAGADGLIRYYYMDTEGNHDFHFSKENLGFTKIGFYFKKNSLYQEAFNIMMMKMWDHGIMQKINNDIDVRARMSQLRNARRKNRQPPQPPSGNIKLVHIVGGFIIMAVGYFMALISLICEIQKKEYEFRKKTKI